MVHLKQLNKYAEVVQTAEFSQYKFYLNSYIIMCRRWFSALELWVYYSHDYIYCLKFLQ